MSHARGGSKAANAAHGLARRLLARGARSRSGRVTVSLGRMGRSSSRSRGPAPSPAAVIRSAGRGSMSAVSSGAAPSSSSMPLNRGRSPSAPRKRRRSLHAIAHLVLPGALALLEARDLAQGTGIRIRRQRALGGHRGERAAFRAAHAGRRRRLAAARALHFRVLHLHRRGSASRRARSACDAQLARERVGGCSGLTLSSSATARAGSPASRCRRAAAMVRSSARAAGSEEKATLGSRGTGVRARRVMRPSQFEETTAPRATNTPRRRRRAPSAIRPRVPRARAPRPDPHDPARRRAARTSRRGRPARLSRARGLALLERRGRLGGGMARGLEARARAAASRGAAMRTRSKTSAASRGRFASSSDCPSARAPRSWRLR